MSETSRGPATVSPCARIWLSKKSLHAYQGPSANRQPHAHTHTHSHLALRGAAGPGGQGSGAVPLDLFQTGPVTEGVPPALGAGAGRRRPPFQRRAVNLPLRYVAVAAGSDQAPAVAADRDARELSGVRHDGRDRFGVPIGRPLHDARSPTF